MNNPDEIESGPMDSYDLAMEAYESGNLDLFWEIFGQAHSEFPIITHYLGELEWGRDNENRAEYWWALSARGCYRESFSRLQFLLSRRDNIDSHRAAILEADEYSYLVDPALDFIIAERELRPSES
jgi:hypothetical protein